MAGSSRMRSSPPYRPLDPVRPHHPLGSSALTVNDTAGALWGGHLEAVVARFFEESATIAAKLVHGAAPIRCM